MGRFFRFLLLILTLAALGAVGYVAVSDIPPPTREIVQEVPHDILYPKN